MINISGTWTYKEDFEFGKSEGKVEIIHNKNKVFATFSFTEEVENDYRIKVVEKTEGTISVDTVLLESTEVTAIQDGRKIDYLPNHFEVHLVSKNRLVGSTYDKENVCGVFVMEKV